MDGKRRARGGGERRREGEHVGELRRAFAERQRSRCNALQPVMGGCVHKHQRLCPRRLTARNLHMR